MTKSNIGNSWQDIKWKDCTKEKEKHEFFELDNDEGVAKCKHCEIVLFQRRIWVYSDSGIPYGGYVA